MRIIVTISILLGNNAYPGALRFGRCVAALRRRPRADSSSFAASAAATARFFETDLPMCASKSNRGEIIKSHLCARKNNRTDAAFASALSKTRLTNFRAGIAKRRKKFGFWFWPGLARLRAGNRPFGILP